MTLISDRMYTDTIVHDLMAKVQGAELRAMLGTCGRICGQPGHADHEKPHIRNEACWNWKSLARQERQP